MKEQKGKSLPELYSENELVRALVQMLPGGPIVDALLAYPGNKIREKRFNDFLQILYSGLKLLESKIENFDYINTEEFYDLFTIALESSIRSRSKEKIILNVMILTSHLTIPNKNEFNAEEYLQAIADLTPLETKILGIFYDSYINDTSQPEEQDNELKLARRINAQGRIMNELGLKDEELLFVLQRMERTGLIKELPTAYWDYSGDTYTITYALTQLMHHLSNHPFSKMKIEEILDGFNN